MRTQKCQPESNVLYNFQIFNCGFSTYKRDFCISTARKHKRNITIKIEKQQFLTHV